MYFNELTDTRDNKGLKHELTNCIVIYLWYSRGHWSIENNLHWILDMHFREDWSLCKEENALKNLAAIRIVITLRN